MNRDRLRRTDTRRLSHFRRVFNAARSRYRNAVFGCNQVGRKPGLRTDRGIERVSPRFVGSGISCPPDGENPHGGRFPDRDLSYNRGIVFSVPRPSQGTILRP